MRPRLDVDGLRLSRLKFLGKRLREIGRLLLGDPFNCHAGGRQANEKVMLFEPEQNDLMLGSKVHALQNCDVFVAGGGLLAHPTPKLPDNSYR